MKIFARCQPTGNKFYFEKKNDERPFNKSECLSYYILVVPEDIELVLMWLVL